MWDRRLAHIRSPSFNLVCHFECSLPGQTSYLSYVSQSYYNQSTRIKVRGKRRHPKDFGQKDKLHAPRLEPLYTFFAHGFGTDYMHFFLTPMAHLCHRNVIHHLKRFKDHESEVPANSPCRTTDSSHLTFILFLLPLDISYLSTSLPPNSSL